MRDRLLMLGTSIVGFMSVVVAGNVAAQGYAAVPGQKGGQDIFGP